MDQIDKNGSSLRKHKKQLAKQKGIEPEFKDDYIELGLRFLWRLFWVLWNGSTGVTLQNIYYWQKLTGISLDRNERELLMRLSNETINYLDQKSRSKK